jgi:hypothetical protein
MTHENEWSVAHVSRTPGEDVSTFQRLNVSAYDATPCRFEKANVFSGDPRVRKETYHEQNHSRCRVIDNVCAELACLR